MLEIENPFDSTHDYTADLKSSETFEKDGTPCVLLRGLQRLAHANRGGVKAVYSNVLSVPARDNPIAAVTVQYEFYDGTKFSGSADATPAAHDKPYSLHLVAVAEAKAEARALRRAFNISRVSAEEVGSVPVAGGDTDGDQIKDVIIQGIKVVAKRKNISFNNVLKLVKRDVAELSELTQAEGRTLMKKLNSKKVVK